MNTKNIWSAKEEEQKTPQSKGISSSQSLEWTTVKLEELKIKEEKQKSKEEVQVEIMSYFIQNPENNITLGMNISKDSETGCEVIDFWNAQHEDEKLNNTFSPYATKRIWWVKLIANETWNEGEEFSKELVIDRKTAKKWMLLVWKKWFNIEQVDFEDITKYDVPYETYFVYKDNWQAYIRLIKNEKMTFQFKTLDSDLSWKIHIWMDELKNINPELLQQAQEQLITTLKDAKNKWTLDSTINMLLSQMPVPEEAKNTMKNEFYKMAQDL